MSTVTDPALIARLNAKAQASQPKEVSAEQSARLDAKAAAAADWGEMSSFDKFATGAGKPGWELYYGAKDLVTDLSEEDKAHLMRLEQAKGGWASGGEMLSDTLMLAPLGGPATKGVQMLAQGLPKALGRVLAPVAPIAAESALVGGYEALKMPETGETRGEKATDAALMTGGLGAVMKGAPGLVRTMAKKRLSDPAKILMKHDVDLTPGMAYKGRLAAGTEKFMADLPFVGRNVEALQDKALSDWNKHMLQKISASPYGTKITKAGREGFKQVQKGYTDVYKKIWSEMTPDKINLADLNKAWTNISKEAADLPAVKLILNKAGKLLHEFKLSGNVKRLEEADDLLRDTAFKLDPMEGEILKSFRKDLHTAMPADAGQALKNIDKRYAKYAVFQRAGSYVKSLENDNLVNPRQLQTAIKSKNSERALVKGEGRLQKDADMAEATFGKVSPQRSQINVGKPISNLAGAAGAVAAPHAALGAALGGKLLTTPRMNKLLTGQASPGKYPTAETTLAQMLRMQAGIRTAEDLDWEE